MVDRPRDGAPRVLPFGDHAVLVALDSLDDVVALDGAVRAARAERAARAGRATALEHGSPAWDVVVDQVPGARTLLLRCDGPVPDGLVKAVRSAWRHRARATQAAPVDVVELEVVYDGADLDEVADLTGLTADEVVRRHAAPTYTVAFGGFVAGFAYLVGLDPELRVPRRPSPRERVPAGSVALADEFTAVYPAATPGGWRLLGRCDAPMFDLAADPPARLTPGSGVRFVPVAERIVLAAAADGTGPTGDDEPRSGSGAVEHRADAAHAVLQGAALLVVHPGLLTLVQDRGRPGWAHVGVGRCGAADRGALALANRLVGNPPGAAALEALLGGLHLRAAGPVTVAITGAPGPAWVDGVPVGRQAVLELGAGAELRLGLPDHGLRTYVAVRGGIDVAPVLGSRSGDRLAAIGPAPLAAGDVLPVGPAPTGGLVVDLAPPLPWTDEVVLPVTPGPQAGWFHGGAHALVLPLVPPRRSRTAEHDRTLPTGRGWTATPASDRVAVRLGGPPLVRVEERVGAELAPAGLVPGAVQVPPDGLPVVFVADHPVTGGYPVVAVVRARALDRLAQVRPGEPVRFVLS